MLIKFLDHPRFLINECMNECYEYVRFQFSEARNSTLQRFATHQLLCKQFYLLFNVFNNLILEELDVDSSINLCFFST